MLQKFKQLCQNEVVRFISKTFFYLVILFVLLYLYSYSGINQPHFIYNEF
ncbi:teichoic acid D-Ala incorporation-associated protein DltX [Ligilactobacillus sp. WILCCON 0076]|uniref:Teichoic acid D-Ala incorporation-associated protein DltX n=1 Tax=Ligilactobacillus ubinensis TaxID=2876789 RepID=A0A9X2JLD9_9LACO|nr:teichoic acid D-Ala incorporation-associated protein DltX [Ligilactobacillus ubinensis]MCP0886814.1 teichoic acid D-Ala incorporation-associated protein DltX [Ligilactobacillus ubinensis]